MLEIEDDKSLIINSRSSSLTLLCCPKMLESKETMIKKSIQKLLPSSTLSSSKSLTNYFASKLRRYDISRNQIKINRASLIETIGEVNIIEIQGVINGLGTKEISLVLGLIEKTIPYKFNSISLVKNSKNNLINIKFDYEARGKK